MKKLMTVAAVLAVLGAPVFAQDDGDDTAAPAATAQDPAVEIVFWDSIKDSDNADLFLDYLQRFPEGVFRVIAEERLKEIYGGGADSADAMEDDTGDMGDTAAPAATANKPTAKPAPSAQPNNRVNAVLLNKRLQRQLKRLGCYYGRIDGIWGPASRAAARKFNQNTTGANISAGDPGQRALGILQGVNRRVCF